MGAPLPASEVPSGHLATRPMPGATRPGTRCQSRVVPAATTDPAELLQWLLRGREGPLVHVHRVPPRHGATEPWPAWVPTELRSVLLECGIAEPWRHQVEAAEAARSGENVIISTGTA